MSQSILTNANLECRSTAGLKPTLVKLSFSDANLRVEGATSGTKVTIDNLADPTSASQATTKSYVDNAVSGVSFGLAWKEACQMRTTENLPVTYSNGTLTADAPGAIPQFDGQQPAPGDRVLVFNQTAAEDNGIYVVTQPGDNNQPYEMDRAADANSLAGASDIRRGATYVDKGTTYGGRGYVESGDISTLGTDPVQYSLIATISELSATDGLEASGKNIKVKTDRGIGIINDSVALNDLGVDTQFIADLAVETSKIADGNVTALKLSGGCIDNANKFLGSVVDNNALAPNCVTEAKINGKAISNASIVNGTLTAELFGVGAVDNSALGGNSVGNSQIQDGAVTNGKIAGGAVQANSIGTGVITSQAIGGGEVKQANIGTNAIITSHINNGNITTQLLNQTSSQEAVTTETIRDANVTIAKMADDSVGADQLVTHCVGEAAIASAAITDRHLGSISNLTLAGELVAASVVVGGSGGTTSYSLAKVSHLNYNFATAWPVPSAYGQVPAADSKLEFPYSDKVSALRFTAVLPVVRTTGTGTDLTMKIVKRLWNAAGTAMEPESWESHTVANMYEDYQALCVVETMMTKLPSAEGDQYVAQIHVELVKDNAAASVEVPVSADLMMIGLIVSENSGTTQKTYTV